MEQERSEAIVFSGRLLALLTAQEAAERFVCDEYERSIAYIRSMLVPVFGEPKPLPPSPIILQRMEMKNPKAKQKVKQNNCPRKTYSEKTDMTQQRTSSPRPWSSSIEFSQQFETLLEWSKGASRAKSSANSFIAVQREGLIRQKISDGEKRFLTRLHSLDKTSPSYQAPEIHGMQMLLSELVQNSSSKTIGFVLRMCPGGRVARRRDAFMSVLLEQDNSTANATTSFVDLRGRRRLSNVSRYVHDDQWLYKAPGVASILEQNLTLPRHTASTVTYNNLEQLLRLFGLLHHLQSLLTRWYLEANVAEKLLRSLDRDRTLSTCKLAHSLLCKQARNTLVIAERESETESDQKTKN